MEILDKAGRWLEENSGYLLPLALVALAYRAGVLSWTA